MISGAAGRWTGGARMLSGWDYEPLGTWAVLDIMPGRIELRVRSAVLGALQRIEDVSVAPGDAVVVHPARQTAKPPFHRLRPGVALQIDRPRARYWQHEWDRQGNLSRWPAYYFWTSDRDQVLATAAAAGFEVSSLEQSIEPRESASD
jgi:hypothetical protein